MDTSVSPVGILPRAAEILKMRAALAEIADHAASISYDERESPARIRGAARVAEAAAMAADALFGVVSTASSYADDATARAAIAARHAEVWGRVESDGR